MKKILFCCLAFIAFSAVRAQKETFDIISYTPPSGWEKAETENLLSYTITDKTTSTWCRINIVKSTVSKGSIDLDFESEWNEMIVKSYGVKETPQQNDIVEADGWKIKAGAGKFIFNNGNAIALLTTISGYTRCVSVVSVTNNQDYIKDIEALLSSIELKKPDIAAPEQNANTPGTDDNSIIGLWTATSSDQSSFRVKNGVMNYIVRQYTFSADGKYSFFSKAFDPLMDKILLGKENGTYQISGTTITITPKKSVLEAWSKKNGVDDWGKMLSSQNITLEKITYQFSKHYFSGIKEMSLILQSDKPTKRDGPYSGNRTINNSWIYGPSGKSHPVIELPGK